VSRPVQGERGVGQLLGRVHCLLNKVSRPTGQSLSVSWSRGTLARHLGRGRTSASSVEPRVGQFPPAFLDETTCPVPVPSRNRLFVPIQTTCPVPLPSPAPDRASPTRDESRPGLVLAHHTSEGRFPRAFLDETTSPVPVPRPSFPLVRPLRRGRAVHRVPSQRRLHRQDLPSGFPRGRRGSLPLLRRRSPPRRGSFPRRAGS
jgi:hypothetical protein